MLIPADEAARYCRLSVPEFLKAVDAGTLPQPAEIRKTDHWVIPLWQTSELVGRVPPAPSLPWAYVPAGWEYHPGA
jgi:hypothetical protein